MDAAQKCEFATRAGLQHLARKSTRHGGRLQRSTPACPILSPSLRRLQLAEEAAEAQPDAAEMPPARCLPGHRAPPPVNQHRPGAGKHLLPIAFYYLPKFKKPATRQKLSPCEHHAMESLGSRLGWDGGEPKAVLG